LRKKGKKKRCRTLKRVVGRGSRRMANANEGRAFALRPDYAEGAAKQISAIAC